LATSLVIVAALGACTGLDRRPPPSEVHVVYDPANSNVPLPNDLARDEKLGYLALPITTDLSAAEIELRKFMNTHDAWPTTFPLQADLSGPVDPKTVSPETVLVYEWGDTPSVVDVAIKIDGTKMSVDAPYPGWKRGAKYVVAVVGGRFGVRDTAGAPIGPDETFYFLRARERLDTYENNTAFPGATRAERMAIGAKLEKIRSGLVPFFEAFEKTRHVAREDISALWTFTVTSATELAMDAASQRVPLPFDPLIDPKTKLVNLPPSSRDSALEASAKLQLNRTNGFGVAPSIAFELTQAVDPASAAAAVHVYALGTSPREMRVAGVRVLPTTSGTACATLPEPDECTHVVVDLDEQELPLPPATTFAILVDDALRPRDGGVLRPMIMGHFLRAASPLVANGKSQVQALSLDQAQLLEGVRAKVDPIVRAFGRDHVVAAWSFTTMDAAPALRDAMKLPDAAAFDPTPNVTSVKDVTPGVLGAASQSEISAFSSLFPEPVTGTIVGTVYVPRLRGVRKIVEGTIASPYTLDRTTRGARADGGFDRDDVHFVLTLPDATPGTKVPVMIFGHGLMTDRRFVLTISGALAQKGIAAIAFDFLFHGERTKCTQRALAAIPNPFPQQIRNLDPRIAGNLIQLPPCPSGSSCSTDGRCLKPDNTDAGYAMIPFTGMTVAGGSALIDVDDIPHVSDRMRQSLIDMAAVRRSLRRADWAALTGVAIDPSAVYYSGQSLGGILGAVFVALEDDVTRAVLNVPGADEVDLFNQSTFFAPQMQDYFVRQKIADGSYERERMLGVAHWLIDTVDPQSLATLLRPRPAYMQMDQGDIVIPNFVTKRLQRATNLPMKTYPSPLHGDLVVPVVGDTMLSDLVTYLVSGTH